MNMKLKLLVRMKTLFVFLSFLSFTTLAQKAVPELWNVRVHDEAHVLKQETIDQLELQLKAYEDSTSNQIAILIIPSLEGESLEDFSFKVAEHWKLGKANKDNGVLLLIAVDDHKMRIEVGQGLEGVLTDALCSRIIRNEMAPNFRRSDFDTGVTSAINAITAAIKGEYTADDTSDLDDLSLTARILIGLGIYAFLGIFAFFALIIPGGWGWAAYAFLIPFFSIFPAFVMGEGLWFVPGLSYILGFPVIKFLVSRTKWGKNIATKMGNGSGGSSGSGRWTSGRGWSSGSSSSSSSSSSWGSSGSSFSGGGGSFGGGGSSGSW